MHKLRKIPQHDKEEEIEKIKRNDHVHSQPCTNYTNFCTCSLSNAKHIQLNIYNIYEKNVQARLKTE